MLTIGDKAPNFSLVDQDEQTRTLTDFSGELVLIYFYPKDDTPGCTKEACLIAEVYSDFKKAGVAVVGVSKDSQQSHKKFAEKYSLPFTLLADTDGKMIEAYGAWQEKTMFGKTAMGINRMSYLVDTKGIIVKVYPKVDPANHALEILKDIKSV